MEAFCKKGKRLSPFYFSTASPSVDASEALDVYDLIGAQWRETAFNGANAAKNTSTSKHEFIEFLIVYFFFSKTLKTLKS